MALACRGKQLRVSSRDFIAATNARHADTEGMGIGLFMAKNIVEKQNGKISMKSEGEGKGSTFYIHLPLYKNSAKHI
jgi:signal transduction histidine kinase